MSHLNLVEPLASILVYDKLIDVQPSSWFNRCLQPPGKTNTYSLYSPARESTQASHSPADAPLKLTYPVFIIFQSGS